MVCDGEDQKTFRTAKILHVMLIERTAGGKIISATGSPHSFPDTLIEAEGCSVAVICCSQLNIFHRRFE